MKSLLCPHCNNYLSTKYNLRKHIEATHLQLRPFECGCCSKAFSYKHSFISHMKMHLKEESHLKVMNTALRDIASILDTQVAKSPVPVAAPASRPEVVLPKLSASAQTRNS